MDFILSSNETFLKIYLVKYLQGSEISMEWKPPKFKPYWEDDKPTLKPEAKQPEIQPKPKQDDTDKTDRYFALLRNGLIVKEDFIKLVTSNNKETTLVGHM